MQFKQIEEIVNGTKTQTRRVCKPGETSKKSSSWDWEAITRVYGKASRLKWRVGWHYAVSPGRGLPGVWWGAELQKQDWGYHRTGDPVNTVEYFKSIGWHPLRIRLLSIRHEPVQDITEADAIAEGVQPELMTGSGASAQWSHVSAYRELWESINGPKSWDANPDVWVLTFEVVK